VDEAGCGSHKAYCFPLPRMKVSEEVTAYMCIYHQQRPIILHGASNLTFFSLLYLACYPKAKPMLA